MELYNSFFYCSDGNGNGNGNGKNGDDGRRAWKT
jgi:hypothetical protein